jgi:hypothetical protein
MDSFSNSLAGTALRDATGLRGAWATCLLAAMLFAVVWPTAAHAARYDPLDVIAYEVWRDVDSMSEAQIQAFLTRRGSVLASVVTSDHTGARKPASRIIHEAARAWSLNPKVILATLQKEQSLIARRTSTTKALREAMGCGVFPGSRERYPGFGMQVWHGARKLSTYETDFAWRPGAKKVVTVRSARRSRAIVPKTAATFALYTYTPYYPQRLFWDVYVRYFGDPKRLPVARPVHRLIDVDTGAFLYTSRTNERFAWTTADPGRIRYDGVAFSFNPRSSTNTAPLYRLYESQTGAWTYTDDPTTRDRLLASQDASWSARGSVCSVSPAAEGPGSLSVFALESTWNGAILFTSRPEERLDLTSGDDPPFIDRGIAFGVSTR